MTIPKSMPGVSPGLTASNQLNHNIMSYIEDEIPYKGMTIKIIRDLYADSPATWDNPDAFLCSDYRDLQVDSESLSADDCREAIESGKWFLNGFYVFPVCIYDHSGIALHLGESHGWDYSNGLAFVCVRRRKGWSWEKAKAEKIADGVLEEWNQYLHGEVYGFQATDASDEIIDSCWGFYGAEGIEDAIEQAKSAIDYEWKARLKAHLAKRKEQIKSRAPYYARTPFAF